MATSSMPVFELKHLRGTSVAKLSGDNLSMAHDISKTYTNESIASFLQASTEAGSSSRGSSPGASTKTSSTASTPTHKTARFGSSPAVQVQVKNTFLHVVPQEEKAMSRSTSSPALLTTPPQAPEVVEPAVVGEDLVEANDGQSLRSRAMTAEELAAARAQVALDHENGSCKPCLYFVFKEDSCRNGLDCLYCHRCTREEILAKRKSNKQAARKAKLAERFGTAFKPKK